MASKIIQFLCFLIVVAMFNLHTKHVLSQTQYEPEPYNETEEDDDIEEDVPRLRRHYEGESLDTPTLNLEEDENTSDDSEATTTQILTAVLKHSDKTVTDPEDSKEEINYENQPELIIDTKDLEMRETSFESSSEVIRDKKEREIVATPVENRPAHWSKTCDEAKAVNKHFSMITSKVDPIKADEACYRQSLGSPLTECKKTKEDEDFLITECQTCSITLKMNKYGVLITCFDCQKLQGDNNCIINKKESIFRVSTTFFDISGFKNETNSTSPSNFTSP